MSFITSYATAGSPRLSYAKCLVLDHILCQLSSHIACLPSHLIPAHQSRGFMQPQCMRSHPVLRAPSALTDHFPVCGGRLRLHRLSAASSISSICFSSLLLVSSSTSLKRGTSQQNKVPLRHGRTTRHYQGLPRSLRSTNPSFLLFSSAVPIVPAQFTRIDTRRKRLALADACPYYSAVSCLLVRPCRAFFCFRAGFGV